MTDKLEDFDEKEFLDGVEELAAEAGDWRAHLPYGAIRAFHLSPAIKAQYSPHVGEREYGQDLLNLFGQVSKNRY